MKQAALFLLLFNTAHVGSTEVSYAQTEQREAAPKPNRSGLNGSCFSPHPTSPIIKSGDHFRGSTWNDPSVLKIGGQYVMYASSDVNFNRDVRIYRLVSDDGLNWRLGPTTAVLEKDAESWDSEGVETPSVVFFKGKFHLFYTGYANQSEPTSYRIGYATSLDGLVWRREPEFQLQPTNPASSPNLDFRQYVVAEPGVAVFQNKLYLYFTALGANQELSTTLQVIGVTISNDGHSWTSPQIALAPDQRIHPRASPSRHVKGFSTPQPVVMNGEVHLYVAVVEELGGNPDHAKHTSIHHAVSPNGISEWKQDSKPLFSRQDFPWTSDEIRSPSPWLDGERLRMWFAGHAGLTLGIGEASCDR